MVREFHTKFGFPVDRNIRDERTQSDMAQGTLATSRSLREFGKLLIEQAEAWRIPATAMQYDGDGRLYSVMMMAEEFGEFAVALAEKNEQKAAHELADLAYTVYGRGEQYNIPLTTVFVELHKSNMTKEKVGDRMRTRDQPPTYLPPDIRGAVVAGRIARRRGMVGIQPKCDCGAVENGYVHAINCPAYYANAVTTKRFSCKEPNEANRPRERDTLELQTKTTFAWVIERGDSEPSRPDYFTGDVDRPWSNDPSLACRFSREIDARRASSCIESGIKPRFAEHGWEE
jgi:phosphoribosyl-ATP pyrophosphohydrolase